MRRLVSVVCVGVTAVVSTAVHADEAADRKRGRQLWTDANKQYDLGDFDTAIKTFEEAYRLWPNPQILNNLGQAERQLHNYQRAIFYFRSFLRHEPSTPNRPAIEQLIIELQALDDAQKASAEHPPDTVHTPPPPPPAVPVAATQAAPVEKDTRWYQDAIGWTLAGTGLVAIGVGTGFLVHSNGLSDDATATSDQRQAQSLLDSSHTFQIAGGVTLGIGAALVIGGVVKMVLHENHHTESKVSLDATAGGFRFSGVF